MNPSQFAYQRAESVDEAIALLQEYGEGAKLIAGGHSLLPIMKLRLAEPELLIDIGRIPQLGGVRHDGSEIAIGALVTHHHIATDAQIQSAVPLLADDPNPSEDSIRHGLEGNICRCTGYHNIVRSVQTAAKSLAAGATPEPLFSRDSAQAR